MDGYAIEVNAGLHNQMLKKTSSETSASINLQYSTNVTILVGALNCVGSSVAKLTLKTGGKNNYHESVKYNFLYHVLFSNRSVSEII